jgi:ribulose-phosphate 3-epimerase
MTEARGAPARTTWAGPGRVRICPSILSADFARLKEEIARVERAGADFLHVDVMDGRFVPNITFGPIIVEAIHRLTKLPLDVHLMVADPLRFLEAFASAGADHLIVHAEAVADAHAAALAIKKRGLRAGVSVRPGTPIEQLVDALPVIDIALIMSVEPGAGGQAFLESALGRIARVRAVIDAGGLDCLLEVDGGIGESTAKIAVGAGADTLVAGHSIFHAPDPEAAVRDLRAAAAAP